MIRDFYYFVFRRYNYVLKDLMKDCDSVLDLGCGKDSPIKLFSENKFCVGVDAFKESLDISKVKGIHDEYLLLDVKNISKSFESKSFDCVIASDVIEHLSKDDGLKLIRDMERIARKLVIVTTPNGFCEQDVYDDNEFQKHKSGWVMAEFVGYRFFGHNGLKCLKNSEGYLRFKPKFFWIIVDDICNLYSKYHPEVAFHFIAYKEVGR